MQTFLRRFRFSVGALHRSKLSTAPLAEKSRRRYGRRVQLHASDEHPSQALQPVWSGRVERTVMPSVGEGWMRILFASGSVEGLALMRLVLEESCGWGSVPKKSSTAGSSPPRHRVSSEQLE